MGAEDTGPIASLDLVEQALPEGAGVGQFQVEGLAVLEGVPFEHAPAEAVDREDLGLVELPQGPAGAAGQRDGRRGPPGGPA